MSDAKRERLLDIQKREQLKGLLSNKFKLKYGKNPNIAAYIDNEVGKFLKNDRLTEQNLKMLDDKINKESLLREKKEAILDEVRSNKSNQSRPQTQGSRRSVARLDNGDAKSVASSRMSGASKLS